MSNFFKSIRIQNLLSFGPDSPELELKPINIVIGPNGSGKSNLLAALQADIGANCRLDNAWFWNHNISQRAVRRLDTTDGQIVSGYIDEPQILAGQSRNEYKKDERYRDESQQSNFIFFFRDWQYGPSAPIRSGPQPVALGHDRLRDDGRNLAHVLRRITENEQSKAKFLEFLHELYEDIEDIVIEEFNDYLFFSAQEKDGLKIPAARISDGTLRYLALLAILCDPEPPKLICLEEPEMGLHPDLIQVIAKAIRYASERTQIIATTHSVLLVDKFTDTPESIVICEKIDGSTELRRLDPEELAPWLEKYRLGNLWTSGQIGGNRW